MKKILMSLILAGVLMFSAPMLFAELGQASWNIEELETIYEEDIDGEFEVLAVTPDGYIIIKHRGRIYVLQTKNK